MIQTEHLDRIREDPFEFAEVLKRVNIRDARPCTPRALLKRLDRKGKIAYDSSVIVDYLRERGIPDDQIFSK